jgi:hypothetical protein
MAKAPKKPESEENDVQATDSTGSSLPPVFEKCRQKWGDNPELWTIIARNAFEDWKKGAPAPEGEF